MKHIKKAFIFFLIWIIGLGAFALFYHSENNNDKSKQNKPSRATSMLPIKKEVTNFLRPFTSGDSESNDNSTQYGTQGFVSVGNSPIIKVAIVNKELERRRGLSGKAFLPLNEGMLFVFSKKEKHLFWMRKMNFPIDILWIDGDTVVDFVQNAPTPESGVADKDLPLYGGDVISDRVLEVNAGWIRSYNIKRGDRVDY